MTRTLIIARAYIVDGHRVLVDARKRGHRLFGGKIKAGEGIRDGLRRELYEELGANFQLGQVVGVSETVTKKRRTLEIVLMAHPTPNFEARARDKHCPRWIDIAESGMRFGVTLE